MNHFVSKNYIHTDYAKILAMKLITHINMYVYYVYIMYIMYIMHAHMINTINMTHFNKKNGG